MIDTQRTRLVADLLSLEERIEAALESSRGPAASTRRRLYLELLGVLNGTGRFDQIPERVPNTGGLTQSIYRRLNGASDHALARAIYEHAFYRRSESSLLAQHPIHPSLWIYVQKLARMLNVEPSHGQKPGDAPPAWMIDIDESYQHLRVWIRELALQDILLAAMEAYEVPAGSGKPHTEIYGTVFGSFSEGRTRRRGAHDVSLADLNVERVCIQHRAKGSPSEVFADSRSEVTQLAMSRELFPFWHLVGDFHTHTYRSLSTLVRVRGWRYSSHDERVNVEWCERLRALGHRPRVALILAMTRAGRQRCGNTENWSGMTNVVRATIGKCHCFISAYRIRPDGRYSDAGITLKCPRLVGYSAS